MTIYGADTTYSVDTQFSTWFFVDAIANGLVLRCSMKLGRLINNSFCINIQSPSVNFSAIQYIFDITEWLNMYTNLPLHSIVDNSHTYL